MIKIIAITAALMLCGSAMAQINSHAQIDGPEGSKASCQELDKFLVKYKSTDGLIKVYEAAFNVRIIDWTPEVVEFLKSTADSCAAKPTNKLFQKRGTEKQHAEEIKQSLDATLVSVREKTAGYAKERAEKAEADAKEQAEKEKQQRLGACESSRASALYRLQEHIINEKADIAELKARQAYEQRVVQTSKVRNLWKERNIGEQLVRLSDALEADLAEYKRLGGKASTPQKVTHQLADPCTSLR